MSRTKVNPIIEKETKTCNSCGKTTVSIEKNFYGVKDSMIFPSGRLSICKQCCYTSWEEGGLDAFLDTLRILDKPLLADRFEMTQNKFTSPDNGYDEMGCFKEYMKNTMSIWSREKEWRFLDSTMFEENKKLTEEKNKEIHKLEELTEEELVELQGYWGHGKSEEQYIWLTSEFSKYVPDPEKISPTMEDLIAEICLTRLEIRTKRDKGQDVDKQIKTLNDLMTAAGIKPTQESGTGNSELDAFSKLIDKLENTRPVRDPKPEWKDVDGIRKMIVSFFLHPWARLWNKEKESPYYDEAKAILDKYTVKPRDYGNGK